MRNPLSWRWTLSLVVIAGCCVPVAGQSLAGLVYCGEAPPAQPCAGAQVLLLDSVGSIVSFAIAGPDGAFAFPTDALPSAGARVVQFIGFRSDTLRWTRLPEPRNIARATDIVRLLPLAVTLAEAVVKTKRQLIEQRGDTTVFQVAGLTDRPERSIGELLNEVPGFRYDDREGLRYQGKSVTRVLVDGDDAISGKSGDATLRTLKALDVDQVRAYTATDSADVLAGERLTVDLRLSEAARDRWRPDVGLAAGPGAYRGRLAGYRVGETSLLVSIYSSNGVPIPFSYQAYDAKLAGLLSDDEGLSLPAIFLPSRRVFRVDQQALEFSGGGPTRKGGAWRGFVEVYRAGDSLESVITTALVRDTVRLVRHTRESALLLHPQLELRLPTWRGLTLRYVSDWAVESSGRHSASERGGLLAAESFGERATRQSWALTQAAKADYRTPGGWRLGLQGAYRWLSRANSLALDPEPSSSERPLRQLITQRSPGLVLRGALISPSRGPWSQTTKFELRDRRQRFSSTSARAVERTSELRTHQQELTHRLTYRLARWRASAEGGFVRVSNPLALRPTRSGVVARVALEVKGARGQQLSLSLQRQPTGVEVSAPPRDTVRLDVLRISLPVKLASAAVVLQSATASYLARCHGGRGLWGVTASAGGGQAFLPVTTVADAGLLAEQLQVLPSLRRLAVSPFVSGRWERWDYHVFGNVVGTAISGTRAGSQLDAPPVNSLLLQLGGSAHVRLSDGLRLGAGLKADGSQVEGQWFLTGNPTLGVEVERGPVLGSLTYGSIVQAAFGATSAIPNLGAALSVALGQQRHYRLGLELGRGLRGPSPVELDLPRVEPGATVIEAQRILGSYVLLTLRWIS